MIIATCALIGAVSIAIISYLLRDTVLNVVTYRLVSPPLAESAAAWFLPGIVVIGLMVLAGRLLIRVSIVPEPGGASASTAVIASLALATVAAAAIGGWLPGFWTIAAKCIASAVLVDRLVVASAALTIPPTRAAIDKDRLCLAALIVAIIIATVWHAWMQREFWRHFMLGYADFGLYTRELEYCLYNNDIADRWANTRMGYHFEPLFYLLAPAYALFRSPMFLMVVGPLALNSAALAFYWLAARRTESPPIGLTAGLAWLALPSISRMPYANTYGFESVYLAVPLLAFCFAAAHLNRWRTSHVLLVLAILCQETMVAIAVGWGIYIAIFRHRRREGSVIAIAAVAYLAICAGLIVPAISPDGQYVRSEMVGDITVSQLTSRLSRRAYWAFLFALTAPLLPVILRSPRMLIATAPTLLMLGLIQNTEYLSIKFWHQSSVLPAVFTCACLGATRHRSSPQVNSNPASTAPVKMASAAPRAVGGMAGVLAGVLILHQVMGYSPFAQSWKAQKSNTALRHTDPRMETMDRIRDEYPPSNTRVVTTERIAAHLIDYQGVSTIEYITSDTNLRAFDIIIIDTQDTWDPVVRSGSIRQFIAELPSDSFALRRFGDIWVFVNQRSNSVY